MPCDIWDLRCISLLGMDQLSHSEERATNQTCLASLDIFEKRLSKKESKKTSKRVYIEVSICHGLIKAVLGVLEYIF